MLTYVCKQYSIPKYLMLCYLFYHANWCYKTLFFINKNLSEIKNNKNNDVKNMYKMHRKEKLICLKP